MKCNFQYVAILALLAITLSVSGEEESVLSANEVMNRVRLEGAYAVVTSLSKNDLTWQTLIRNVRSGEPAWLSVGEELSFTPTASLTEEITEAIQQALDTNPAEVLRLHKNPIEEICSGGDLDTSDLSVSQQKEIARKRIRSILNIKDKKIPRTTIKRCVGGLRLFLRAISK